MKVLRVQGTASHTQIQMFGFFKKGLTEKVIQVNTGYGRWPKVCGRGKRWCTFGLWLYFMVVEFNHCIGPFVLSIINNLVTSLLISNRFDATKL